MGNKIWIGLMLFGAFLFAVIGIVGSWYAIHEHDSLRFRILLVIFTGSVTWQAVKAARSRIKYGPSGPPPDPLENFHVDF